MVADSAQRLERLDRDAEQLRNDWIEALDVDGGASEERWIQIVDRIRALRANLKPQDFDKDQVVALSTAMLDAYEFVGRLDTHDQFLIRLERIRHVIRDALDEHVNGVTGNTSEVVRELVERLPGIPRGQLGQLLGVDRRTLPRWFAQTTAPTTRLDLVARLVAILRHNWTPAGIVAWFHRPRPDLAGRTPLELLDEQHIDEAGLIAAARAGRSHYAS